MRLIICYFNNLEQFFELPIVNILSWSNLLFLQANNNYFVRFNIIQFTIILIPKA